MKKYKMDFLGVTTAKPLLVLSILGINSTLIVPTALAEEVNHSNMETIVVTGEKIDKNIKDTTTAVTVISEAQIGSGEIQETMDLATKAPNVVTDSFGNISIRGMSGGGAATGGAAFTTGSRSRVATVVDGSTQDWSGYNFNPTTLWDVQQVEILRGPQSTTQGASAIAGAVVVNTNDPTFYTENAVRAGVDRYTNGNARYNLAVMSSGAIIEEQLAYRIAIDSSKGEGWINYKTDDYDVPNLSDQQSINVRGKLLWKPEKLPKLSAKLTLNYHKNEGEHSNFVSNTDDSIESETLDISSAYARVQDSSEHAFAIDVDYKFKPGVINSLHINHIDTDIYADGYYASSVATYDIQQKSTVLENRLIMNPEQGRLSGIFGVYLAQKKADIYAFQGLSLGSDYTTKTIASYGEGTYALTPKTKATLGLRIESEDIEKVSEFFTSGDVAQDESNVYFLPKVALTHEVTDSTTLGASIRQGFTPAGTGVAIDYSTFETYGYDYDSETVTAYELSSKSVFANGLRLNASIFYNDYTDYQALSGFEIVNVAAAHAYGLEIEATTWVTDNLELWGSLGLLQTEIDDSDDYQGNELSSAPGSNLALGFTQYIGNNWSFGADMSYVGEYYSDLDNSSDDKVGDFIIPNARLQYSNDSIIINAYIKNFTDETAVYYRESALATVGQSRTIGLNLTYRM